MTSRYVKAILRRVVRRHEKGCLCRDCRANLFFDLAVEQRRLKDCYGRRFRAVAEAIEVADLEGRPVPDNVRQTFEKSRSAMDALFKADIPDVMKDGEYLEVIWPIEALVSMDGEPIAIPTPSPNTRTQTKWGGLQADGAVSAWSEISSKQVFEHQEDTIDALKRKLRGTEREADEFADAALSRLLGE